MSESDEQPVVNAPQVRSQVFEDDGVFPNNPRLPVLVYLSAVRLSNTNPASKVEHIFNRFHWGGHWRNGIYSFHHYHSTAHEVLGIYSGKVQVLLGGPKGRVFHLDAGDVVVIPAGVAHINIGSSSNFRCVGAYPDGQNWDMNYGKEDERTGAFENISRVALPTRDPIMGENGPIQEYWY